MGNGIEKTQIHNSYSYPFVQNYPTNEYQNHTQNRNTKK